MKTLLAIVAVCVLALLTSLVVGQARACANQEAGVLAGYFLAWHEDSWKRIDSGGGIRFQPLRK